VTITPTAHPTNTAPVAATSGNPAATPLSGANVTLGNNTAFPLTETVIQIQGSGVSPATTNFGFAKSPADGGATLTVNSWNPAPGASSTFTLEIPGLGITVASGSAKQFSSSDLLKGAATLPGGGNFRLTAANASYAALGFWEVDATIGATPLIFLGSFITGYETPVSGMPTTGTANYAGTSNVAGIVTSLSGGFNRGALLGDASYTANFGTNSLTGAFTNINVISDNGNSVSMPWNNVSVTGTISGSHFSGSATAASPALTNAYTVTGGTTGHFDGSFYGPNANELAGVWSFMDATHVVTGVAHGKQGP